MVCRGKTGVGFWVSRNMPCSTARTSAYLCVRGSSPAGGVYYFTWVCSTEQENQCNDEPMESGVSIYPIIHYSAVERTLTTDTKEDTEVGWRHP